MVVHNGIIENYLALKQQLQREGHRFVTETDTEIVAHLIEHECRGDGARECGATGAAPAARPFALVLISADDPDKIVAVRNGPPSSSGIGDDEYFVASDIPAILSHTRDIVFLGDEEMAVVTPDAASSSPTSRAPVSKVTQRVLWDPVMAEKAGYKHFMLKEIFEQPAAVRETVLGRVVASRRDACSSTRSKSAEAVCATIDRVVILACGTSWHAGARRQIPDRADRAACPWKSTTASEYRYRDPIVDAEHAGDRHHAVRRNGRYARGAARGEAARARAALAICNVVGSMATRETEGTVYTHAGPEIGVASTKAFTSQLAALHLLALYLAQTRGRRCRGRRSGRTSQALHAAAAAARAGAEARHADRGASPSASTKQATSSTSDAASTTRSRSKAR